MQNDDTPSQTNKSKTRLDVLVVAHGLAETRQKAQALILTGDILVDNVPQTKAGLSIPTTAEIRLREGAVKRFVSRGGEKIEPAFVHFRIRLDGVCAMDIGASTGGFTDCMLQRGAAQVYAVDVGTNQLSHRLRVDPRVVVMEQTDARDLPGRKWDPKPTFATFDVSFIGLAKVLAPVSIVLAPKAQLLAMVKPQFEVGPDKVGVGGVVRDEKSQLRAVHDVEAVLESLGWQSRGFIPAGLRGARKGNQEYFIYAERG